MFAARAWDGAKTSLFIQSATGVVSAVRNASAVVAAVYVVGEGVAVVVREGDGGRGRGRRGVDCQESKAGRWWRYERLSTSTSTIALPQHAFKAGRGVASPGCSSDEPNVTKHMTNWIRT